MTATRSGLKLGFYVGGAALLTFAALAPVYQRDGILPSGGAALPIAAGIASLVIGMSWGTALQRAALWLSLAIVGQAASLQLIDAGTRLHYQHYRPWGTLFGYPVPFALLLVQLTVVLASLRRHVVTVRAWVARELGVWRAAALLVILVLMSATLSEDVSAYLRELVTSTIVQLVALGNIVMVVCSIPDALSATVADRFERLLGPASENGDPDGGGADRFAWSCAAVATLTSAILAVVVYERHPHVQDEVKYLLQARYFAHGMLAMPTPPVPEAFKLYLFDVGPRGWYSIVTPGWPVVLAIGELFRVPWLVNPVLTGLNIVLAYVLLRSLYDLRTARIATLLLLLSPMHIFLGMTYMAQASTLTCALLAAILVQRSRREERASFAWLAGMMIGFCSIVRQLDALIVALVLGLWSIGLGGKRLKFSSVAGLVLGTALTASLILPYNAWFTGKGTVFPIMEYHDRLFGKNSNAYGFGPDRGMGWALDPNPGHGPVDATINANLNTTAMNVELLGWSIGSLLLAAAFLLKGKLKRPDVAVVTVTIAVFIAYFFNYFSGGPDFGARYWDLMSVPLLALTARGITTLGSGSLSGDVSARVISQNRMLTGVVALTVATVATFLPWRSLDKYHHYLNMRPVPKAIAQSKSFNRSLILIRGAEYPDYASAAVSNPLDLRADAPVFARDASPEVRRALLQVYGDRPIWIVDGPTLAGGSYRMVAGPLTASQVLSGKTPP